LQVKLSKEEVRHVASLARLDLTGEEIERFATQLNEVLQAAGKLQQLDTEEVEPTVHVVPVKNVLRKDEVTESLPDDQVLANAPDRQDGYFRVPRILSSE